MTDNTHGPAVEADHARALYDTQLRLNGKLADDIAACRQAHAEQADELSALRDRDAAAASLAEVHNKMLEAWGSRLSWLEDLFIASLEEQEREAPARRTLASRAQAARMERSAGRLVRRMDPAAE